MINRAQQQQPRTEGQGPPKRDRRRTLNKGGRDITEEIMSGKLYTPMPTLPQGEIKQIIDLTRVKFVWL
uniref:Uncharacterized protein n=1 Tax=Gouania willdenowi TaxID=441366 RepID=A0A8C5HBQ0_GOUWI